MEPAIAFFGFNRLAHTQQSIRALLANESASRSDLVVFCDGPRTDEERRATDAVVAYCKNIKGFRSTTVTQRGTNMGCGRALEAGLKEFFTAYPSGVVVEDDVLLAPNALRWFKTCLERYEEEPAVFSIGAWSYPPSRMAFPAHYPYDAYFLPRFQCWGWASWADRISRVSWQPEEYDLFTSTPSLVEAFANGGDDLPETLRSQQEGRVSSWAIRVAYSAFKHGQLSLAPRLAYATNIGTAGEGTHVGQAARHPTVDIDLALALDAPRLPGFVAVDPAVLRAFQRVLRQGRQSWLARIGRAAVRRVRCGR